MKPRSSNQMRVALVVLAVVAAVFFFFFFRRFEGLTARSTTIGMYDHLKPIPEGNKWTSEVRSKFMKTYNQIPNLPEKIEDPEKVAGFETWASQAEAEYYITNRVWPIGQYVKNYITNNPEFISKTFPNNSASKKDGFVFTNDNISQIFPNRILYLYLSNHNQEANRKPLSYQYFMGTALPPDSEPEATSTPTESGSGSGSSGSSGSSVSELKASQPTKR
jgi:hypothetical protein